MVRTMNSILVHQVDNITAVCDLNDTTTFYFSSKNSVVSGPDKFVPKIT